MQLNQQNLAAIQEVMVPTYDRSLVKPGIVHIGLGNFHRAHQAVYIDQLLAGGKANNWGIISSVIRAEQTALCQAMNRQDGLYTVQTFSPDNQNEIRIIGSILETIDGIQQQDKLLATIAAPETRLILLTVTEGGYYFSEKDRRLTETHPDLQADLQGGFRSVYAYLTAGLERRMKQNGGPVTLLSCDNLKLNGSILKQGYFQFLDLIQAGALQNWSNDNLSFPNCMVDRITPRTDKALTAEIEHRFGYTDLAPISAESYLQWVLEDNFIAGRPAFEDVGVELVSDIYEKEETKIRILNGGHCAVAWMAAHRNYTYFYEAMADNELALFLERYTETEVMETLDFVRFDLTRYFATIKERFKNPHIPDTIERLAAEGASRLPKFVLPVIYERLSKHLPVRYGFDILAAWYFALEKDQQGLLPFNHMEQEKERVKRWFAADEPFECFLNDAEFWEYKDHIKAPFQAGIREAVKRMGHLREQGITHTHRVTG